MASSALRSIWHTLTSNDRHSTIDSPFRSGRHVPLSNDRNAALTSIATALESRADITSPYSDETGRMSSSMQDVSYYNGTPYTPSSPIRSRPYSPGLRSSTVRQASQSDVTELASSPGEIQMQNFQDGLPPPPPVTHSWEKIDAWCDEHYPELLDQMGEGATNNDLNELEHQLDCSLPHDVRESLMVHDGQERGGIPTGIIFSSMLLDCEEIVQEWENWRKVNQEFLLEKTVVKPAVPTRALGGSSRASSSKAPRSPSAPQNTNWRQDLLNRQEAIPPNSIKKAYAHPRWIPLVRDWGGNNLAVDLSPGPSGQWGQIILFGRDYDTKYVVARSWAAFLALFADDLSSGKWYVDEETSELRLREFRDARVEPSYFNILRWRMDQKHGRRAAAAAAAAKRRSMVQSRAGSPTSPRSMSPPIDERTLRQRSPNLSPTASSARLAPPKRSPLSRNMTNQNVPAPIVTTGLGIKPVKLVEVETPRPSEDVRSPGAEPAFAEVETNGTANMNGAAVNVTSMNGAPADAPAMNGSAIANGKKPAVDDGMETIGI